MYPVCIVFDFPVCTYLVIIVFEPPRLVSIVPGLIVHPPICILLLVFTFQPLGLVSLVYLGLGLPLSASFVLTICTVGALCFAVVALVVVAGFRGCWILVSIVVEFRWG